MSTWLYQLNAQEWSPDTFRYEIWEGKPWHWGDPRPDLLAPLSRTMDL